MATFDKETFASLLQTKEIGRTLVYTDVTGSTMDDARRLAHQVNDYPHGTAILSERQTKARGARDHKWDASNTENIYASFILHVPPVCKTFEGRFAVEVAACLAVMRVARKFSVHAATPKWPNDVWVKGHKLAGFLVEDGRFNIPGSLNCLIVLGMGINVNADVRRNPELSSIATSVRCERGGKPVHREHFFAEVCLALEYSLRQTRAANLETMRQENLFQISQDISAFCPSEGRVIDGKFLEICDNWEVRFSDKNSVEIFQGRSDHYTIRPKVLNKIVVVFTMVQLGGVEGGGDGGGGGGGGDASASAGTSSLPQPVGSKRSAQRVASTLQTLVDTSRHVVCLLPESFITDTEDWMKTCSLLVLPEPLANPDQVTVKLKSFLGQGGRALASGMGALYLAKTLHIPLKEIRHEPSQAHPGTSLVYVEASLPSNPVDPIPSSSRPALTEETLKASEESITGRTMDPCPAESDKLATGPKVNPPGVSTATPSQGTQTIVIPSGHVCFQFFENEKAMLAESTASLQGAQDKLAPESVAEVDQFTSPAVTASREPLTCSTGKTKIWAVYSRTEDGAKPSIAACTVKPSTSAESSVALVGFDIGADFPSTPALTAQIGHELQRVFEDRFHRDVLLQQILGSLL